MTNHFANPAETNLSKSINGKIEFPADNWTIRHIGAGVGLLGGTFILFGAVFLMVFQFLNGEQQHGHWLFALVLPLWIIGAHCFDKVEELEKARRIEYCKRQGMTEEKCKNTNLLKKT